MLHLVKLCVGAASVGDLRDWQARRGVADPPLRHQTRNTPRRAAELVSGGSLYWVIKGAVLVRQRLLAIAADHWDDGTACAGLVLDPTLVLVVPRPMKPFQGWRYLTEPPPDLDGAVDPGGLPAALRQELAALCLL